MASAHCETAGDGVEMRVTRAKQVSPTPLGWGALLLRGKLGGQAKQLAVVHLATLGLDDREAAFIAMPQVAGQSAAGSGRRVSRASGDLASW
jgi:hypothetical protein